MNFPAGPAMLAYIGIRTYLGSEVKRKELKALRTGWERTRKE